MAFKEVNFEISKTKEVELLEYITKTCNCKLLNPLVCDLNEAIYNENLPINSYCYIIKNQVFEPQYELEDTEDGKRYVLKIIPNDSFDPSFTLFTYERMPQHNEKSNNRLFVSFDYFSSEKNNVLRDFNVIKKWIKSNAQKSIKFGKIRIYSIE